MDNLARFFLKLKGGPGSGNKRHAGRPGKRGGSTSNSFSLPINEQTELTAEKHVLWRFNTREKADEMLDKLKECIENSPVCVRVPGAILSKILSQGEIKNQHQTGTSRGMLDSKHRSNFERNAFGNELSKPEDFPIYGYFSTGKYGIRPGVGAYGEVKIEFKPEIKDRTTVTVGDSMAGFVNRTLVGTPANNPRISSLDNSFETRGKLDTTSYVEAQIHGGVKVSDISKVYIRSKYKNKKSTEETINKLNNLGIAYEFQEDIID